MAGLLLNMKVFASSIISLKLCILDGCEHMAFVWCSEPKKMEPGSKWQSWAWKLLCYRLTAPDARDSLLAQPLQASSTGTSPFAFAALDLLCV